MTNKTPSWYWLARLWLAERFQTLSEWLSGFQRSDEWMDARIHKNDTPGVWVAMDAIEYQALIFFGYPHPDGQEVDWDLEDDSIANDERLVLFTAALRDEVARRAEAA